MLCFHWQSIRLYLSHLYTYLLSCSLFRCGIICIFIVIIIVPLLRLGSMYTHLTRPSGSKGGKSQQPSSQDRSVERKGTGGGGSRSEHFTILSPESNSLNIFPLRGAHLRRYWYRASTLLHCLVFFPPLPPFFFLSSSLFPLTLLSRPFPFTIYHSYLN